jgi:NAD(P)-dependent dehydrogenase (short-subunit alcohol dehydrogenase family)
MSSFTCMKCDLASFESVRQFTAALDEFRCERPIDRFVCNAAVYQPSLAAAKWTEDNIEQQMQINFLSHFLMASLVVSSRCKQFMMDESHSNFLFIARFPKCAVQ